MKWQTSFAQAVAQASALHKPIFVDFYAEWCGPCKMLEQNVFPDARVKSLLSRTVCLRLNIDQHVEDAKRYSVNSIPRLMLFSPDGKRVRWDTMGYREADQFVQEFSEALGVKPPDAATVALPNEPPTAARVRAAINAHAAGPLDPDGLKFFVQQLGAFKESDFRGPASLLESAGRSAVPALLEGMRSKTLAVRVGSYKVLQTILAKASAPHPAFDPWGSAKTRSLQLAEWQRRNL